MGVPLHNDAALFEFILLDTFQAGLSWRTILHKRENFRRAFDNFDVQKIALYKEEKIQELMLDVSIVRNQAKIRAAVTNAQHFIRIQEEFGTFDRYIWQFTGGKPNKTILSLWWNTRQISESRMPWVKIYQKEV